MCFGCLLHAAMWRSHKVSFKRNFPINCVVVFCVAKFAQGETTLNSCLVVWLRFYFSSALISSDSIWSLLLSREQHPMWQYTTGWNARSLYSKCDATSDIHTRKLETLGTWSVNSARRYVWSAYSASIRHRIPPHNTCTNNNALRCQHIAIQIHLRFK